MKGLTVWAVCTTRCWRLHLQKKHAKASSSGNTFTSFVVFFSLHLIVPNCMPNACAKVLNLFWGRNIFVSLLLISRIYWLENISRKHMIIRLRSRMLLQKRFQPISCRRRQRPIVPYKVSYMKATSCLFMGVFCGSKNRPWLVFWRDFPYFLILQK